MFAKSSLAIAAVLVIAEGILNAGSVMAQTDAAALEASLKAQYKLATIRMDNGAVSVVQPGTVLVIQEDGILGVPPSESNVPLTTFKVQEGVRQPGTASRTSRLLRAGDRVYVTKIGVDSANDSVLLTIVECDACNNVQKPSSLMSRLVFELPKGYLQMADASQVSDAINEVLLPEAAIPSTPPAMPAEALSVAQPTQTAFPVRHRHISLTGPGSNAVYYCSGELSVSADGTVRYDCTQTDDPSGRCDHVAFSPGSLKQAKISYGGILHLASKGQGNADFYGDPVTLKQVLAAITSPAQIAAAVPSGAVAASPTPAVSDCRDYDSCMKRGAASLEQAEGGAEALREFQKASQLDPSKGEPWAGMGDAYLQTAQYEDATSMWDKALQRGVTLSSHVCHAGMACGDTGDFQLSMKEVSFINKKEGKKEFTAAPSAVTSEVGYPRVWGGNGQIIAYYVQLRFSGKNYRFYYGPKSGQCRDNFICPEPGLTQQKVFADYVHNTLAKLATGTFASQSIKP